MNIKSKPKSAKISPNHAGATIPDIEIPPDRAVGFHAGPLGEAVIVSGSMFMSVSADMKKDASRAASAQWPLAV
jgi:hypothetical protein